MNILSKYPLNFYWAAGFLIIFTIVPVAFISKLEINNAPRVYLPPDAPAVLVDDKLRKEFPSDQGFVLLFEGENIFSDSFLLALSELTEELESIPDIEKVVSVTSQEHISGTDDGFSVEPLIDISKLNNQSPSERKARIMSDRFANRATIAGDSTALAIIVFPKPIDESFGRMALQDQVLKAVSDLGLRQNLTAVAGQITTDVEQTRTLLKENLEFIPAITSVGLLLIWLLFRSIIQVAISALVLGCVVSSTVALFVVFNQPFNMISSILPPMLSALTIAALVHFYNALLYASKRGHSGRVRVDMALAEIKRPALFTALTTMAGFSSLGLTSIPPIRVFGLVTAAGVGLVYFVVYHLLPYIFYQLDGASRTREKKRRNKLDALVSAMSNFGTRHPLATISFTLITLGICLPSVNHIKVETNLLEFFSKEHETRLATEYIQRKLVGTSSLDIVFSSAEPGDIILPANLDMISEFQIWAENQPEVDKSLSLADYVKEMHWGFNSEDAQFRKIPENADLISQYLFIYDGDDIYDLVDESFHLTYVRLNINVHGANELSQLMERIRFYLANQAVENLDWDIAGISRMFADEEDLLIAGQLKSLVGALALIFLLMLVLWRSWRQAFICMIPNLAPILLIFIIMGALDIRLNFATALIASVAVGIAVDDTIHIFHGFIRRVDQGSSPVAALVRTYRQAGRAVTATTIILCTQFFILIMAEFVPIQNFGVLTCIGLLAALFFDLVLLPAILIAIYGQKKPRLR